MRRRSVIITLWLIVSWAALDTGRSDIQWARLQRQVHPFAAGNLALVNHVDQQMLLGMMLAGVGAISEILGLAYLLYLLSIRARRTQPRGFDIIQ